MLNPWIENGFDLVMSLINLVFMEVTISEFKAKCIQMIKTASESESELVVTLRGKPLAKVVGILHSRQRVLGGQRNAFIGDPPHEVLLASDFESDWES